MSKRGADIQLSKDGGFQGDGANQQTADEKPQRATAAQLANRKLKPLKGRTRPAGSTSSSFPGASQPAPGGVGSNPFSSSTFTPAPAPAPAPANNGFSFSFGGPPSTAFNAPANDAMDTSVSPQKQPPPASNNLFAQSASSAMPSSGSNLFASFSKPDSGNMFSQSTSSSNPFQFGATTSTAPPASSSSQPAQNLFASATQNNQASSAPQSSSSPFNFGGFSQGQNKTTPEPANNAPPQSTFNFNFGANTANASQPAPAFSFGAPAPAKDAQEASSALTTSSAPSASQPTPAFSFNAPSTTKDTPAPLEAPKPFSSTTASQPTSAFTFGATNASKDSAPSSSPFSFGAPSSSKPAASSTVDQPSSSISQLPSSSNLFAAKPSFPPSSQKSGSDSNTASSAPSNPFSFATSTSTGSATAFSPATPAKTTQPTPSLFGSTTPAPSFTPTKEPEAQQEIGNNDKAASTMSTSGSDLFKPSASSSGTSTASNLFGSMTPKPSGGANNLFSSPKPESTPAQSNTEKSGSTENPSKSAFGQSSSGNIFAAAAASKPSNEKSGAPVVKPVQPVQPAPSNGSGERESTESTPTSAEDWEEKVYKNPEKAWIEFNRWWKNMVAEADIGHDYWRLCDFYLEQRLKIRKRLGIARSDDLLEPGDYPIKSHSQEKPRQNGSAAATSPKKQQQAAIQDTPSTGAAGSQTANIFSSIVNKSSQSSPQTAANGSQSPAAGASSSNAFGASTSSAFGASTSSAFGASTSKTPVKAAAPLGDSTSTTPAGSPVKRDLFSAQTPSKSGPSGQLGNSETPKLFDTGVAKRKSGAISADDAGDATQESAQEKRQKTDTNGGLQPPSSGLFGAPSRSPTPGSSANNGSVLNSGAASPNPNNPFSHLSQDESTGRDDDDDEDEDGEVDDDEAGSGTPTQEPKTGGGLFGRITKDDSGKPAFGTPPAKNDAAGTNIFGFAQTGPVNKTWSGDSDSPIKFSTPQPASSSATDAKPFNPFASLTKTTAAPSSGSASTPFKFNPTPATTSDSGSVLGTASGSRAATPGLPSTGASEAEDDEAPAPVDTESIKLRTALTDEDKSTYEILFDTDDKAVSTMRLVDKTEEELAADPKKQPKKWVVMNKGPLRVLKHKETGAGSILLKAEPMGRAVINSRLQANLIYKRAKPKFAALSLPLEAGKLVTVYVKFEDDADCTKFVDVCEANKS